MASRPGTRGPSRPPERTGSDLGRRVLAALPAIAFAIFIVVQGGLVFALGVAALGMVCLHELYLMAAPVRPVNLAGFLGVTGLALAAVLGGPEQVLVVAVAVVPVLFLLSRVGPQRRHVTLSMAVTLLGVYWIGFGLAHAILLRELPHGDGIVVDVLVGTFLGDTGAYFGGKAFGRAPLAPRISPNKTIEGLAFGMATAIAAVWFAGLYQDWLSGADAFILGVAVAVVAPIGDLFESLIKRDLGVKDTGAFFGAHGGALDRLDAALFTVVVGYYVWAAMV